MAQNLFPLVFFFFFKLTRAPVIDSRAHASRRSEPRHVDEHSPRSAAEQAARCAAAEGQPLGGSAAQKRRPVVDCR